MATARKSTQRPSTARRPTKKAAASKASSDGRPARAGEPPPTQRRTSQSMRIAALSAAAELSALIGRDAEGIVGVEKNDDTWRVLVEVVESRRIPDTTDILAVYEVDVDADGAVTGYRRQARYVRGRIQE
jgi:hypothetical protein